MVAKNVLSLIGNTPMVQLQSFDTGPCSLFVKMESQNPGGSIKDRIGLSMIEAAEREGHLQPGGTIVEATAGNTGLGLALVAAQKGYRLILVIPDKMSQEKIFHLNALGAEVILTRSDVGKGHPEYYHDKAEAIAAELDNAYYINQFNNPSNPLAHERSTGPEIYEQMECDIDAVVCGVGSGGTITGLGKYFAEVSPKTEMVLADPKGSILAHYIETGELLEAGSWYIEGIGEDFIPALCDLSYVKKGLTITDQESFQTARKLLKDEGILGGSSCGTLVAAAVRYCQEQTEAKRVVTFICDSGNKYLSKMFNEFWMRDHGFIEYEKHGNLRDFITRRFSRGAVVSVGPKDSLLQAYKQMKLYDISQLPVLDEDRIVGMLDESDLLYAVLENKDMFSKPVSDVMADKLKTFSPHDSLKDVIALLRQGYVAIIAENDKFHGLITRMDLLNQMRLELEK